MKKFLPLLAFTALFFGCQPDAAKAPDQLRTAVFIPGNLAGSPIYEMMDSGVRKAAAEIPTITVKTIEGGFNQATWGEQMTALAASGEYDLIVTANPAMPEIAAQIALSFPNQKFLCLEGYIENVPQIAGVMYNHRELGFLLGAFGAKLTEIRKGSAVIGLIAGQEYPVMNNAILPGFQEGFNLLYPSGTVDFRVVGNWYDATKAIELSKAIYRSGAQVILPIAGGANQGVLTAAKEEGKSVLWYDTNGYDLEQGVVMGSGLIRQDKAAYEMVVAAAQGKLPFGISKVVGLKEGYIGFNNQDPLFLELAPMELRKFISDLQDEFIQGKRALPMILN
ncbi:MAG: hypothetical protein A2Z96_02710 [Spirochaetes bacterium GWB1_48_6]|nr:MAG: hypothetical protein A2Z96_02710 [Spirochaetes bacterium GWB1_48_6]